MEKTNEKIIPFDKKKKAAINNKLKVLATKTLDLENILKILKEKKIVFTADVLEAEVDDGELNEEQLRIDKNLRFYLALVEMDNTACDEFMKALVTTKQMDVACIIDPGYEKVGKSFMNFGINVFSKGKKDTKSKQNVETKNDTVSASESEVKNTVQGCGSGSDTNDIFDKSDSTQDDNETIQNTSVMVNQTDATDENAKAKALPPHTTNNNNEEKNNENENNQNSGNAPDNKNETEKLSKSKIDPTIAAEDTEESKDRKIHDGKKTSNKKNRNPQEGDIENKIPTDQDTFDASDDSSKEETTTDGEKKKKKKGIVKRISNYVPKLLAAVVTAVEMENLWETKLNEQLKKADLKTLQRSFRKYDANQNGRISSGEFYVLMQTQFNFTLDESQLFLQQYDLDNDGEIDYFEFAHMFLPRMKHVFLD